MEPKQTEATMAELMAAVARLLALVQHLHRRVEAHQGCIAAQQIEIDGLAAAVKEQQDQFARITTVLQELQGQIDVLLGVNRTSEAN